MRNRIAVLIAAIASLLAASTQAITLNITGNRIQDENGNNLPFGSTCLLVVSTGDSDFGDLTSLSNALDSAFVNEEDDVIIARWAFDENDGPGSTIQSIGFTLGDFGTASGDPLLLVWYSGLQENTNPTAPGAARRFGTYRDESWVVPGDNSAQLDLTLLTTSIGGPLSESEGLADQITAGTPGSNTPPTALCQNVNASADSNCVANVTANQVDDGSVDTDGTIVGFDLSPAGPYPLGDTIVTLTLTDDDGATNSCSATITVADTAAPAITCPSNLSTTVPPLTTEAVVNYGAPTATDNCSESVSVNCAPPTGATFPVGETLVTCTGVDQAGNTNQCTFTVTVNQEGVNLPPVALCTNLTVSADSNCVANVAAEDVDNGSTDEDGAIANRALDPAGPYPLGETVVTLTVTDDDGATNSCSATITVADTTAPSILCPANIATQVTETAESAIVNYTAPTASDNCSTNVIVNCAPSSGSAFPIGTNLVTCTAVDDASNTNQCNFNVIVTQQPPEPTAELVGLWDEVSAKCKKGKCKIKGTLLIENIGDADSEDQEVRFFLSTDNQFDAGDELIGSDSTGKVKTDKPKKVKAKAKRETESVSGLFLIAVIGPDFDPNGDPNVAVSSALP